MGPEIIFPVVVIAVVVPVVTLWAKHRFKDNVGTDDVEVAVPASDRLTSTALRDFESPPWRVVYEIPDDKLNGVGHVLIGPPGVFALRTSMEPLPPTPTSEPDARAIGAAAVSRGGVDDALRRCGMSSDRLVDVHWGANEGSEIAIDLLPGLTAVDGRSVVAWASGRAAVLTPAQTDLAWQSIVTAIGRPDPLD